MAPPPTLCSNSHCRHQGNPIPPEYFRKGDSPPDCYVYLKRCSDCRGTRPMPLASYFPSPSPVNTRRKKCGSRSIDALTRALTEMAQEHGRPCPILHVAPTGIAAFNIHGSTLHQALSIPVRGRSKLTAQQLLLLQGRLELIKYIILDEKSMVGRRLLSKVD